MPVKARWKRRQSCGIIVLMLDNLLFSERAAAEIKAFEDTSLHACNGKEFRSCKRVDIVRFQTF